MMFCSFCIEVSAAENLKHISDIKLNANFKLREAFKIDIDLLKFSEICHECEEKLEVSWRFYEQVRRAQEAETLCVVKEEEETDESVVSVFVKQEDEFEVTPDVNTLMESYPEYDLKEDESEEKFRRPVKIEVPSEDYLKEWLKFNPPKGTTSKKPDSGLRKPRKSRARGVKTIGSRNLPVSMTDVFSEEINHQNFFEHPESLQELEENPKLWSDYDYTCEDCRESFGNVIELASHVIRAHNKRNLVSNCRECDKRCATHQQFLNHSISVHHRNLKFCCVICSEYHSNLLDLHRHQVNAHGSLKINFCLYCGLHYTYGSYLKVHMVSSHKRVEHGKHYECDICGLKIHTRLRLLTHIRSHKVPDHPCQFCEKVYTNNSDLLVHLRDRHGMFGKSVMCSDCGKTYPNTGVFNKHYKATHSRTSNVICDVCSKVFRDKYAFRNHFRTHKKVGELECPHCGKLYKHRSGFRYHIRSAHTGEKPYKCSVEGCSYSAFDYPNAQKHIRTVHNLNDRPIKIF